MKGSTDRTVRGSAPAATGRGGRGFTLIELLTIVVILGTLISLTVPSILEVKKIFSTAESRSRIHQLEYGIKMYYNDWKDIPPSAAGKYPCGLKGRQGLVQALTGYLPKGTGNGDGDGADGLGSRKTVPGKVFGPYVGTELPTAPSDPTNPNSAPSFIDAFNNNIYYFRFSTVAGVAAYQTADNDYDTVNGPGAIPNMNSAYLRPRQDSGQPFYRVDYILISPGADRAWETFPPTPVGGKKQTKTDDIANFEFQFK